MVRSFLSVQQTLIVLSLIILSDGASASVTVPTDRLVHGLETVPIPHGSAVHPSRNRPSTIDVDRYRLELTVDPANHLIAGLVTVDFRMTLANQTYVVLDAQDMEIIKTTFADGSTAEHFYDGQTVTVLFDEPLAMDEAHRMTIHYRAPNSQSFFTTGPDVTHPTRMLAGYTYTQPEDASEWFPCNDRPADKSLIEMHLKVRAPLKILANGELLATEKQGEDQVFIYRSDDPMSTYLVSIVVGDYKVLDLGDYEGKQLTLWTPPQIESAATRSAVDTHKMMEVFSQFTQTPYPFTHYAQSIAQSWRSSMEHQTATTMGGAVMNGDGTGAYVVAHELAHHWFGDYVTCENWGELWLNEGFATYLPTLYFKAIGEGDRADLMVSGWQDGYFRESRSFIRPLSTSQPNYDNFFDSHAYSKGALIIRLLHNLLDDPLYGGRPGSFSDALALYLKRGGMDTVRHSHLQRAIEETTGRSWEMFFDQWVRNPGHPTLDASWQLNDNELILTVSQTQTEQDWPLFTFPLQVELIQRQGGARTETVHVYGHSQQYRFENAGSTVALNLDPRWHVPATYQVTQSDESWLQVVQNSSHRMGSFRGLRHLIQTETLPTSQHLARWLIGGEQRPFVIMTALDRLTEHLENHPLVAELTSKLASMEPATLSMKRALTNAEAWLVRHETRPRSDEDMRRWQIAYRVSKATYERRALLEIMQQADPGTAQDFALSMLKQPQLVTSDRLALVMVIMKYPSLKRDRFVDDVLTGSSYYWFRAVARVLMEEETTREGFWRTLLDAVRHRRLHGGKAYALRLLAKQTRDGEAICHQLEEIGPTLARELQEELVKTRTALECDGSSDWIVE